MCRSQITQHVLTAIFQRRSSRFDRERNVYICAPKQELILSGIIDLGAHLPYRASTRDCMRCNLTPRCMAATTRGDSGITRAIDEILPALPQTTLATHAEEPCETRRREGCCR